MGGYTIKEVSIFSLPMKSTYVKLRKKYREYLLRIFSKNGGAYRLSKEMGINRSYFINVKNHKISLYFIFKLYNGFSLDLKRLERNIISIVSGRNNSIGVKAPKMPFNFDNKYGGQFLSAVMGDGSRTQVGGITYNNQDGVLTKKLILSAKMIFGNVHYRINFKKDKTIQVDFPKIVGDVVGLMGIERSFKSKSNCYVNINEFSRPMRRAFLRQYYDDEGNVRKKDRRLQIKQTLNLRTNDKEKIRSNINRFAPNMLKEIKKALENFRVDSKLALETLRSHNSLYKGDFSLNVYGIENLEIFKKEVNLSMDKKRKLLDYVIRSYKFPSAPRNGRMKFAYRKAVLTQQKYGYITKYLLAKEARRSIKTATYFLVDLKKEGYLNIVEAPHHKEHKYMMRKVKV